MRKIGLFLSAEPSYGGTFQYNQAMLNAVSSLPPDKFEVVVAYMDPLWKEYLKDYSIRAIPAPLRISDRIFRKVCRIINLSVGQWRKISPLFHSVNKKLVMEKCDLWIFPSQDWWTYEVNVPALGTIHDLMHRYERRFSEVSDNGEYERREELYSNMCQWANGILVDSEVGREQVHESYGMSKEKLFVLPFIPPKYVYNNLVSEYFETKYRLPEKYIFYPAQFWEHKNHVRLIEAIGILTKEFPDIQLVLVGSKKNGYDKAVELVNLMQINNNVHFMGYVPDEDMPEFYRRARALVMPTFFGPTNIPQLEAFVLGCPVATSRIYGIPQQVGDAALLFDPGSVSEIADTLRKLWTDDKLCRELVAKGNVRAANWGQLQFNQKLAEIITRLAPDD